MDHNSANAYPRSEQFDYFTKFEMINFDEECRKDLTNGHGFIIKEPQPINKALKSDDSIFSSKYGFLFALQFIYNFFSHIQNILMLFLIDTLVNMVVLKAHFILYQGIRTGFALSVEQKSNL